MSAIALLALLVMNADPPSMQAIVPSRGAGNSSYLTSSAFFSLFSIFYPYFSLFIY